MYYRCDKYKNEVVLNQLEDEVHKLLWEKEIKEMKLKDEQKEKGNEKKEEKEKVENREDKTNFTL